MTGLITLLDPIVQAADPDPLLSATDDDGRPIGWSIKEVRALRFTRWRGERGDFDRDRDPQPESLPPVDPRDNGRNDR